MSIALHILGLRPIHPWVPRELASRPWIQDTDTVPEHVRVPIIGAGFGGLGAGVRLRQARITDFVILERAASVGGTWRDNSYPGCACDVPSHLYSFSFELNPGWSRMVAPQREIWEYMTRCARK